MKNTSKQTTSKKLSVSSPKIILSYDNKIKSINNKKESSKYEISSKNNNIKKKYNKNDTEKEEEYGYELNQSEENNLNFINDKSNGEDINITKNKININTEKKNDTISSHKYVCNTESNYRNNDNSEIYNEITNNHKNHFYEIGDISKLDGDQTNLININNISKYDSIDNMDITNEINALENNLKIRQTINNNDFNNKNNYIIDESIKKINEKNYLDLLFEHNKNKHNSISEYKKIKKSLILQQILITEMIKEIQSLKLEKHHLKKEYDMQKKNIIDKYEKKINILKDKINNNNNYIGDNIKIDNGNKDLDDINNSKLNDSKLNDTNLNNKINIIKEIKNKNLNIIKEKDIKIKQLIKENNDYIIKNDIKKEKNIFKIIDTFYEIIKLISYKIKFLIENNYLNNNNDQLINKNIKSFLNNINIDNNGNNSINDKLVTINEFNNIISLQLDIIFRFFQNKTKHIDNDKKNYYKYNNQINDIYDSENGQNNIITNKVSTSKKKYYNEKIFKKIDAIINKNRITKSNNNEYLSKKKKYTNYDNVLTNINKSTDENLKNNSNIIVLKNDLLEKNSIVYKSNLSPSNNQGSLLNNSNNDNFSLKYNELVNKILNKDEKQIKFKKIKNNRINQKVKELSNLITNNTISNRPILRDNNNSIENKKSFFKNFKKSKIPLPETIKINNVVKSNKIDNLLSLSNITLKDKKYRPIYKNNSGNKNINHLNFTFDNVSYLTNYKKTNYKRKIPLNENYNYLNINKNERNKNDRLHYIKTDVKSNSEYIKIKDIFQNSNNSNILSNSHTIETKNPKTSPNNIEFSPNKIGNKSFTSNEKKNIYLNINSNENSNKKYSPKKFLKQQSLKKNNNILNTNGLEKNLFKPSFLKNNISMSLNNNSNLEKDIEFNNIKKINLNIKIK